MPWTSCPPAQKAVKTGFITRSAYPGRDSPKLYHPSEAGCLHIGGACSYGGYSSDSCRHRAWGHHRGRNSEKYRKKNMEYRRLRIVYDPARKPEGPTGWDRRPRWQTWTYDRDLWGYETMVYDKGYDYWGSSESGKEEEKDKEKEKGEGNEGAAGKSKTECSKDVEGEEKVESISKKRVGGGGGVRMIRGENLVAQDPMREGQDLALDRELVLPREGKGRADCTSERLRVVPVDCEVNWRGLLFDQERWWDDDLSLDDIVREGEMAYKVRYVRGKKDSSGDISRGYVLV